MSMIATTTKSAAAAWAMRLRFTLAVAALWAGLHFIAGQALPGGFHRPIVLSGSAGGLLAGLLVIGLVWAGAAFAALFVDRHDRRLSLIVIGLALALWAAEGGRQGGTMDDWLIQSNERPGPPTAGAYWRLLGDYVFLLVALAGAHVIVTWIGTRHGSAEPTGQVPRRALGLAVPAEGRRQGLQTLLITTIVAGVAVFILTGPSLATTYRGQVFFAVALGMFAGVFAARRVVKTREPLWYWPAPILLGVIGLIVAGLRPGLMLQGHALNVIPAWGLSRALPVEMVGVGLVGALWMLHPPTADGGSPDAG